MFSNYGKRKQYNKALREFNAGGSKTDAELSAFKKKLKKKLGMSGRTSSFGEDLGNLLSGNNVRMGKTEAQMNFDQVRKDAFGKAMGGLKTKKSRRTFGKGDVVTFTQGSVRKAENQLNNAINRIQSSDILDSSQKSKMTNDLINQFQKQFNINVSEGAMTGRSVGDRLRRFGSGIFTEKPKYTISARGSEFQGAKVAHVANDILKKHGY